MKWKMKIITDIFIRKKNKRLLQKLKIRIWFDEQTDKDRTFAAVSLVRFERSIITRFFLRKIKMNFIDPIFDNVVNYETNTVF